jgi:hypothetical protein
MNEIHSLYCYVEKDILLEYLRLILSAILKKIVFDATNAKI